MNEIEKKAFYHKQLADIFSKLFMFEKLYGVNLITLSNGAIKVMYKSKPLFLLYIDNIEFDVYYVGSIKMVKMFISELEALIRKETSNESPD
jgi:hypothetical protein